MRVFLYSKPLVLRTRYVERGCRCGSHCIQYLKGYDRGLRYPVTPIISSRALSGIAGQRHDVQNCEKLMVNPGVSGRRIREMHFLGFSHTLNPNITLYRHLYVGLPLHDKEPLKPSSKVEQTVQALRKDLLESEKGEKTCIREPLVTDAPLVKKIVKLKALKAPQEKKSLKQKIIDECLHYYHGFRLLFIDINISRGLLWRVLNGKSLTRREHRLLVRTVADLFRLVPFSVFIVVPFMEFLLPVVIKLFPGMLPSTFQTASEKEDKMKQSFKVELEMAKFLQKTLDDMAVHSAGAGRTSDATKEFTEFFAKVRSTGEQPSSEEILKFSQLFEDEITLDSLRRPQLVALCRVLEIPSIGTNNFLRFQLRMKLRNLTADDKVIQKEGLESLTSAELQQACRARGMRAYGVSESRLRSQLAQWLDLSLNEKVPPSLLLLSRALLLPETIPAGDQLKATISVLPETVVTQAKSVIEEREGVIDNRTKIEVVKEELRLIEEEQQELKEEIQATAKAKEILLDKAPVLTTEAEAVLTEAEKAKQQELTTADIETLEDALDRVGQDRKKLLVEKEELDTLKEELAEYKEDVDDLKQVLQVAGDQEVQIKERTGAQVLYKKVNKMISKMDTVMGELEREEREIKKALEETGVGKEAKKKSEQLVSIEELVSVIKKLQKVPDKALIERISEVLGKIDADRDGAIRVDDVLKVIEVIGKQNVNLSQKQVDEILDLMLKEEKIELEEQIEKVLEKESLQKAIKRTAKPVDKPAVTDSSTKSKTEKPAVTDSSTKSKTEKPAAMAASPQEPQSSIDKNEKR